MHRVRVEDNLDVKCLKLLDLRHVLAYSPLSMMSFAQASIVSGRPAISRLDGLNSCGWRLVHFSSPPTPNTPPSVVLGTVFAKQSP
jgi:hypothetical protein